MDYLAAGTWTLIRNPGAIITNGTGTSQLVSGLVAGTYNFTVTSAEGCTSASSADVVISPQPSSPAAPVVGGYYSNRHVHCLREVWF